MVYILPLATHGPTPGHYGLMEDQQRGAKSGCFGAMNNLLIDRAVMLDCQRGKRNLSMAWIDVRKAYDSVDHDWLCVMTDVHRLLIWLGKVIRKLCASWSTRVVATRRHFEQNIKDKYLVRAYGHQIFFLRNPETQVSQNLYFTDFFT